MTRVRALLPLFSLALAASAAQADDDLRNFRLFAALSQVSPLDDSQARLGGRAATVEVGSATGWEAGAEWRMTPVLGLEVSTGRTTHELRFGRQRLGEVRFEPVFAALDVHLFGRERFDFWIAPTAVWLRWKAEGLGQGVEVDEARKLQLGATAGADWSIDETWAVTAAVRYVDSQIEFGGGGKVAVDPLTLRLGVAARF